jgi:hypothetical protein
VLDLRGASADETMQRLELALGSLSLSNPAGIILDDLNEIEDPTVRRSAPPRSASGLKRGNGFLPRAMPRKTRIFHQ